MTTSNSQGQHVWTTLSCFRTGISSYYRRKGSFLGLQIPKNFTGLYHVQKLILILTLFPTQKSTTCQYFRIGRFKQRSNRSPLYQTIMASQILLTSIYFLCLCETHNALQLPMFFFFPFFSFFCQPYPEYRGIRSKKLLTDHWTANTIPLFVPIKRKFLGSILFQNNSQQRGNP